MREYTYCLPRTVQLRGKVTLASARAVTRALSSSARECFTPRSTATRECSIAALDTRARQPRPRRPHRACAYCTHPGLSAPSESPRHQALRALRASALSPSLSPTSEPSPRALSEPSEGILSATTECRLHPPHERELACTRTHVLALALARHSRVLALALAESTREC